MRVSLDPFRQCDGRRPTCLKCEKSRHYACRGYIGPEVQPGTTTSAVTKASVPTGDQASLNLAASPAQHAQTSPDIRAPSAGLSCAPQDNVQPALLQYPSFLSDILHRHSVNGHASSREMQNATSTQPLSKQVVVDEPKGLSRPVLIDDEIEQESDGQQYKDFDLLLHYKKVVCHIMMPTIDVERNPWLQIYLPMAMREPATSSQLALRHALMSVAAYNLAQTKPDTDQRELLRAQHHKMEASKLLTQLVTGHLVEQDIAQKCASLAAAMSLISTDVFGADGHDCNINLNLAKRIVQRTGGEAFWTSTQETSILYQIFRCYDMVASTARSAPNEGTSEESSPSEEFSGGDHLESPPEEPSEVSVQNTNRDEIFSYRDHYILDTTFGIGLRTMSLLHRTIRLSTTCLLYEKRSAWPESIAEAVEALKHQLHSIEESPKTFVSKRPHQLISRPGVDRSNSSASAAESAPPRSFLPPAICDELIENHQWAFHYAVIIYYYRLFSASETSPAGGSPKVDCQRFVAKVFDRLENIDCLTRGTDIRPANTLWPAFIAAAEATNVSLRHRALIWFSKAARRGIGNIPRAKELTMEIWRRVDRQLCDDDDGLFSDNHGLGPVDWRSVMEEFGPSIMLT